jgi:ABC-type nitrate/sulfonate/bicarbonate transport system substrate-binding protein
MGDFDLNQVTTKPAENAGGTKTGALKNTKLSIIIFLGILLVLGLLTYVVFTLKYRNRSDFLTLGYSKNETFALVSIAEYNGYFDEQGVSVDKRSFNNDLDVLKAFSEDKIDLAVIEDVSTALNYRELEGVKLIASIAQANSYFYVLDLKQGLINIKDIQGTTIGVPDSENAVYWFERSASLNAVAKDEVTLKVLSQKKLASELAAGKISGIITNQPYVYRAIQYEKSETQVQQFPAQDTLSVFTVILVKESYLNENLKEIKDFLTTLKKAETYIEEENEDTREFFAIEWSENSAYVDTVVKDTVYKLQMTGDLQESISAAYSWRTSKRGSSTTSAFNLDNLYYFNLVREISPESVEF